MDVKHSPIHSGGPLIANPMFNKTWSSHCLLTVSNVLLDHRCINSTNTEAGSSGDAGADVLQLDDAGPGGLQLQGGDTFAAQMVVPHQPVLADRDTLQLLRPTEVLVRQWPNPALPRQYFRVMDPDLALCLGACGHVFEADEFRAVSGPETRGSWCA